jgi:hypothetical protein
MIEISDEVAEAVDERIEWIKTVTSLGLEHGPDAVTEEVRKLDEDTKGSILLVLMLHYLAEAERLRDLVVAEHLGGLDGKTLH